MFGLTNHPSRFFAHSRLHQLNACVRQMECLLCSVHPRNFAPIECCEQLRLAGCGQVDQMLCQRLFRAIRVRRCHCRDRCIRIALSLPNIRPEKSLRVVLRLLLQRVVRLAHLKNNVGRACIRTGSHRRHIRSFQQKEPRRTSSRTRRSHIHDHRHTRTENRPSHRAHGVDQPARRIHLDQQRSRAVAIGVLDRPLQHPGAHRLNRSVKHQFVDDWLLGTHGAGRGPNRESCTQAH